jgi:uncharacterized Fe-S cluster protein YjdI
MKEITKTYTNNEITIVWKPNTCIHSRICFSGLGKVFNPAERPWVKPEKASSEELMSQIDKCPSGALSYYKNNEAKTENVEVETIAEVSENGPLLVYGNLKVKKNDGTIEQKNKVTAFCRCGASGNKPYCDGSHRKIDFKG